MFPDSQLAKTFARDKTKCKYLECHGIAPYFKEVLTKSLMELEHYVCLFDESYNNITKKRTDGHAYTILGYITKYS